MAQLLPGCSSCGKGRTPTGGRTMEVAVEAAEDRYEVRDRAGHVLTLNGAPARFKSSVAAMTFMRGHKGATLHQATPPTD